jgi:hypothetical protein
VDLVIEGGGNGGEAGGGEHGLEQPPEDAELGTQVLGKVFGV